MAEVDVPSTWTPMKSGERFTRVELDINSDEYRRVEQSVRATCQNTVNQIVKVHTVCQRVHIMCSRVYATVGHPSIRYDTIRYKTQF